MFDKPQQPMDNAAPHKSQQPDDTGAQYEGADFGPSAIEAGKIKPVTASTPKDTGIPGDDTSVYEFHAPATQSKWFLVVAIIIGVLVIAGGIWWAYAAFSKGGTAPDTDTPSASVTDTDTDQPAATPEEANPFVEEPSASVETPTTTAPAAPVAPIAPAPVVVADSDKDGLSDTQEVQAGTDPGNPDSDADGLNDKEEGVWNTDPLNPDTDGDTFSDGMEVRSGYNPLGAGKIVPGTPPKN